MSLPTIPDINPEVNLNRCDAINMLLSSIALEEIGLSNILNAEGAKLQAFLETNPDDLQDYLRVNDSVNKMLRTVVKSQILLQFKLEDVISLCEETNCDHSDSDCNCSCGKKKCKKKSPYVQCPKCKKNHGCNCVHDLLKNKKNLD